MAARRHLESIDSRLALRVYAVVFGLGGFVFAAWGPLWFGPHLAEVPWGSAAIVRLCGAVVMAAALCAYGLTSADVPTRRRQLSWFIAAHAVVWLMLEIQATATLDGIGIARRASWTMLTVLLGLIYVRLPWNLEPRTPVSILAAPQPRTSYAASASPSEQQIRESAAQEERNRLARDLHDAVKQQIFAIQTSAATAEARFDTDEPGTRAALTQVRQSAREAMAEMEAMLEQLRVAPLGNAGLVEAIRKQCEALAFRTGAAVDLRVGPLPADEAFEPGTHQAIFRVVQEALGNVGRHARATRVLVAIAATEARLEVTIQDDGVGFDRGRPAGGMGIHNMHARSAEIGGTVEVGPSDGPGTIVTLSIPFETSDARDYRRKQTFGLTVIFGIFGGLSLMTLVDRGPSTGNVFLVFQVLVFVHSLRIWLRLRRPAQRTDAVTERLS